MLEVAKGLGGVYKVPTMPLVQALTPRLKEKEQQNTYSGNYGLSEFPFHTDLAHWYVPPRYLLLRCIFPAKGVATKLIDSHKVINSETRGLLNRAHFRPRKRLDGKANILKVLHGELFRWDSIFIEPANNVADLLKKIIDNQLKNMKSQDVFLSSCGDCLLIDNWRMLHGRGCIDRKSMNRKIERVYFNEVKF